MGHIPAESVDLDQGGQMVAVLLKDAEICLLQLDSNEEVFMRSLQLGASSDQEENATAAEPAHSLFEKRILVAV